MRSPGLRTGNETSSRVFERVREKPLAFDKIRPVGPPVRRRAPVRAERRLLDEREDYPSSSLKPPIRPLAPHGNSSIGRLVIVDAQTNLVF